MHRLSRATRFTHRDKRRSVCGWRAGSAASKVRFCSTKVWPPPGMAGRICSKCFHSQPLADIEDDEHEPIEDVE